MTNPLRTFFWIWAGQALSVLGSGVTAFAIIYWLSTRLYATDQHGLAAALSLVSLSMAVPGLVCATAAGGWGDRHDRLRTMIAADLLSAALSAVLLALVATGRLQLPWLCALAAAFSVLSAFHRAAFETFYVDLLPREHLPRANGMMQGLYALSAVAAPPLAALLMALPAILGRHLDARALLHPLGAEVDGTPLAVALDGLTFLAAASAPLLLRLPRRPPPSPEPAATPVLSRLYQDAREGVRYILQRPPLRWLLVTFCVSNLLWSPFEVVQPLLLRFDLSADWSSRGGTFEQALALVTTSAGVGSIAGGVAVGVWGGFSRRAVAGILAPMALMGLAILGVGQAPTVYLAAAAALVAAAMVPVMNAHSQTVWQRQTPSAIQGRVFAVRRIIAQCSIPLGTAIAGATAGSFRTGTLLTAIGIGIFLCAALQMVNPALRWLDPVPEVAPLPSPDA